MMHGAGVFPVCSVIRLPEKLLIWLMHFLLERKDGTFMVGVRAPIAKPEGAEELCIKFSSEGGWSASAGTNNLAQEEVDRFYDKFDIQFYN